MQGYDQYGNPWFNPPVAASTVQTQQLTAGHVAVTANVSPTVAPEQDFVALRGDWFQGIDVANTPTARDYVVVGERGTYSFADGSTTQGSQTLTSAAQGGFTAALVGAGIAGSGIPAGATITAVGSTTSLTMSAAATATATGVAVTITSNVATDLVYVKHRGGLSPTLGVGVTPPDGSARMQVAAADAEPAMGTARYRVGPAQTGKAIVVHDSTPTDQWWIDAAFFMSSAAGVPVQAEPSAAGHVFLINDNAKGQVYSIDMPTASGGVMRIRNVTNNLSILDLGTDGSLRHLSTKLGLFGAAPVVKPTITGSRGGNAAVASLLTQGALVGYWIDGTTA